MVDGLFITVDKRGFFFSHRWDADKTQMNDDFFLDLIKKAPWKALLTVYSKCGLENPRRIF